MNQPTPTPTPPARFPIPRDADGLARTTHCHEEPDGTLTLIAGLTTYPIAAASVRTATAFAQTWWDLSLKSWFTPEVEFDLTTVVTSRWLNPQPSPHRSAAV